MIKRELIQFMDGLVELASEENKVKSTGMENRRFGEMQRLTAGREAGVQSGD